MELLSEVRTPAQVLNFAQSRERGQENQKEILRSPQLEQPNQCRQQHTPGTPPSTTAKSSNK